MTPGTVKDSGSLKAGAEIRSNFEMNGDWQSPKIYRTISQETQLGCPLAVTHGS